MNKLKKTNFVSVFKVDGVPILPPLITSEKRRLIQRYREEAIAIERKLNIKNQVVEPTITISKQAATDSNFEDDYLKISNFLKANKNSLNNNKSPIHDLRKSDTLIYDVISNTVIIPYESENSELYSDLNQILKQNLNYNENNQLKTVLNDVNIDLEKFVPSVVIKPPTPEYELRNHSTPSQTDGIVETQNISSENSLLDDEIIIEEHTPLIRTNSFILEKASSFLVEHMDKLRIKEQEIIPTIQNVVTKKKIASPYSFNKSPKIVGYKKKVYQNVCDKTELRKENSFTNTALFKNKKSPYELEKKTKAAKKHKSPILKTSSNIIMKTKAFKNRINDDNENLYITEAIEDIEKQHKLRLMELTKKHQDEQNKMQEAFECKQKLLLEHLSSSTLDNQNFENDQYEKFDEKNRVHDKNSKNNIVTSKFYNKLENKNILKDSKNNLSSSSSERREHAAIIINKYVRGFLTRRIFKTYYVQKIVKTIQDTLLYVINLHKHTQMSDNAENIELKIRLLKQLQTSCYNLHNVLFQLSTKERMALISNDRMYKIKNKLFEEN